VKILAISCALLIIWGGSALADDVGISTARLLEQEPGVYLIEVDVTPLLAPGFLPPVLPARFEATGKPEHVRLGATMQIRYRFAAAGQPLASGERILLPWSRTGIDLTARWADGSFHRGFFARGPAGISVPVDALREARTSLPEILIRQISNGVRFSLRTAVVWLLVAALVLARRRQAYRDLRWLAGGLALSFVAVDLSVPAPPLEVAVLLPAVAAAILVRLAFATSMPAPGLMLAGVGLLLGSGYASVLGADPLPALFGFGLGVVGTAAGQLVLLNLVLPRLPRAVTGTLVGGLAVAAILTGLVLDQAGAQGLRQANPAALNSFALPKVQAPGTGSQVAPPRKLEDPLVAFLTVEPFEVRLEYLLRAADLKGPVDPIEPAEQTQLIDRVLPIMQRGTLVTIDGQKAEPNLARGDFVTVSANGVLTRPEPIAEPLNEAVIGLTWVFDTGGLPDSLTLAFNVFAEILPAVSMTVTDALGSRLETLTPRSPTVSWGNRLTGFEVQEIEPVAVVPPRGPIVTLVLLLAGLLLIIWRRRGGPQWSRPLVTALLILAALTYPLVRTPLAGPLAQAWRLGDAEAGAVLDDLLTNVYRSFDMRDEGAIYDRLARSVDGDQLTEIYLQSRRSLEMENRGGARGRVDDVEILAVHSMEGADRDGLQVDLTWKVSGSVSHFGHIHYRQNRNRAVVTLVPVDGVWKIEDMEILEEERVL